MSHNENNKRIKRLETWIDFLHDFDMYLETNLDALKRQLINFIREVE